ncbi:hypothetical protein L1987_54623 [Smallanthus sonchifolius]|uniref:Uncharacterized protein n=1 Tax=Smallanthus sonchifolius TaxID=185202 RepID=A0ACB9E7M3_9ASTR|nr:hypothetical protein L1987_54623 [Smallanthus sonchifolius]
MWDKSFKEGEKAFVYKASVEQQEPPLVCSCRAAVGLQLQSRRHCRKLLPSLGHSSINWPVILVHGGSATRPGKGVGSVMRYNNNDAIEQQRRVGRSNPVAAPIQFPLPASSYPRRSSACKNDKVETSLEVSGNGLQARPPYIPRKVAAAQSGPGSQWY